MWILLTFFLSSHSWAIGETPECHGYHEFSRDPSGGIVIEWKQSPGCKTDEKKEAQLSSVDELTKYCSLKKDALKPEDLYLCRLQVVSDCKAGERDSVACQALARISKFENHVLDFDLGRRKREKPTPIRFVDTGLRDYNCAPKEPERIPARNLSPYFKNVQIKRGSPDVFEKSDQQLISVGYNEQRLPALREQNKELRELLTRINSKQVDIACEKDSDCQAQSYGKKGCGGPMGYFIYSSRWATNQKLIEEVKRFNFLDKEILKETKNYFDTCEYYGPPEEITCFKNRCNDFQLTR